ncbi:amidohydrolase family protein [Achromobacter piechaudii]|uniref:Amidohydrolase-related domain-containing protein n=1 Tax=Achromobacter piechaudii TaxID=72556 RepID=A0A6S7DUW3_9BURK|nr:amidohydrolase family protein [Achromobacter piechaudii]CAB3867556.1 hypothetical protein LMG1861_02591 [Achromobacter piechaudii]
MHTPASDAIAETIEPTLPIIDSHHHLWMHQNDRYLLDEFQADAGSGHTIVASVYIECSVMYRCHGPQALRCVGETEFAAGIAAMSESGLFGPTRACAAIVGGADLLAGEAAADILDAMAASGGGRLRGIRNVANWDADPSVNTGVRAYAPRDLYADPSFRAGFACLAPRGLAFDAFQYHPQLPEVCDLADAFPDTTIVVNHCGGLLGIGPYAGSQTFDRWRSLIVEAARRPNIVMKLGGLSAKRCGFGLDSHAFPLAARELACIWKPYIQACIQAFGPTRCMFESNFPPDRACGSYHTLWNALKLTVADCTAAEKADLFLHTAQRVYRIQ